MYTFRDIKKKPVDYIFKAYYMCKLLLLCIWQQSITKSLTDFLNCTCIALFQALQWRSLEMRHVQYSIHLHKIFSYCDIHVRTSITQHIWALSTTRHVLLISAYSLTSELECCTKPLLGLYLDLCASSYLKLKLSWKSKYGASAQGWPLFVDHTATVAPETSKNTKNNAILKSPWCDFNTADTEQRSFLSQQMVGRRPRPLE